MRKILKILVLLQIILIIACEGSTEPESKEDKIDIYEIVLRDKFINGSAKYPINYNKDTIYYAYYIGVYEQIDSNYRFSGEPLDPDEELIDRFSGHYKKVKKYSESIIVDDIVLDKATKKGPGIIFRLGPIRWLADDLAETECSFYIPKVGLDYYTFRVYKKYGKWNIYWKTPRYW